MKAKDYIIIPRSEIEKRVNYFEGSYPSPENFIEYSALKSVLASSAPLLPYAEQCWEAGVEYGIDIDTISPKEIEKAKQQFLNQEL